MFGPEFFIDLLAGLLIQGPITVFIAYKAWCAGYNARKSEESTS